VYDEQDWTLIPQATQLDEERKNPFKHERATVAEEQVAAP
jgi:hypothetical protein